MNNNENRQPIAYEPQFADISKPCDSLPEENIIPRAFSQVESIFAWLSLLAGYIFCRVFPANNSPLGAVIFIVSLFVTTFTVLKVNKIKIRVLPVFTAVSAIIISLTLILSGNSFLNFFAYSYSLIIYFYFIYSSTGNVLEGGFSNFILADFIKALFILPFRSFNEIFRAMFSNRNSRKFSLKIIAGLGVAIIPTAVIFALLSYDSSFSNLWNSIFNFNFGEIFSHIGSLIIGIPIGMYIFGLFISSADNKCKDFLTVESCRNASVKIKKVPVLSVISATAPILFVYVIFFISQWQYYISGFTGKLPENLSYAQYAREGFFQLCAVSVINLIIITMVMLFLRRKDTHPSVALKTLAVIFSVFTLILISTALAKMVMYIDIYGLTQKRIYATWLMVVIALIFIFIGLQQFLPKLKTIALSFTVIVVLFATLALTNVNAIIANYNIERYIEGDLKTVDIEALTDLGDNAVPELVQLYNHVEAKIDTNKITSEDFEIYSQLKDELKNIAKKYKKTDDDIFSFNFPRYKAEKAIEDWNK